MQYKKKCGELEDELNDFKDEADRSQALVGLNNNLKMSLFRSNVLMFKNLNLTNIIKRFPINRIIKEIFYMTK